MENKKFFFTAVTFCVCVGVVSYFMVAIEVAITTQSFNSFSQLPNWILVLFTLLILEMVGFAKDSANYEKLVKAIKAFLKIFLDE